MKRLRLSKQTIRILVSTDLRNVVAGEDSDTSVGSGLTICLTRIYTLCTAVSRLCTVP